MIIFALKQSLNLKWQTPILNAEDNICCPKEQEEARDEPNPYFSLVYHIGFSDKQSLVEFIAILGWLLEVFKTDNFILSGELHLCDLSVCILLQSYRNNRTWDAQKEQHAHKEVKVSFLWKQVSNA